MQEFGKKPGISVNKFFEARFIEAKMLLCHDLIEMVHQKHKQITKKAAPVSGRSGRKK